MFDLALDVQLVHVFPFGLFVEFPPFLGAVVVYFARVHPVRDFEPVRDVLQGVWGYGGVEAHAGTGGGGVAAEDGGEEGDYE